MTKQQPYATSLRPSKICRLLIIAFTLKLAVLGLLIFEPALPGDSMPSLSGVFSRLSGAEPSENDKSGRGMAAAAESAGAPPALAPVLPDAAQTPPLSVRGNGSAGSSESGRGLPSLGQRTAAPSAPGAAGAVNNPSPSSAQQAEVRDALARRQEDLARKEQELRVLEAELANRLEKMKMLENRLASMIKDAEETNDAKFRHLVDVLSNMKSKQAAAVLETLDPKIAVRVLAGMRGRQAGEVLTFVRPEVAAQLTESLARMQLPLE